MEEKERYELRIYAGCESYSITDTKEKQQITLENVINLLNKQDKRIKELEKQLEESEKQIKDAREAGNMAVDSWCKNRRKYEAQIAEMQNKSFILYSMLYETLEKQGCENVASQIDQMTGWTYDKEADWLKGNRNYDQLKQQLKEAENYIEEDEVCKREYYQKVDAEDRKKDFLIKKLQKKGEGKDALIEQLQAENKLLKVGTKGLAGLLKSQAKEIVEEVEKNFTEYLPLKDKTGAGFYLRLNAILKKFGGEDE